MPLSLIKGLKFCIIEGEASLSERWSGSESLLRTRSTSLTVFWIIWGLRAETGAAACVSFPETCRVTSQRPRPSLFTGRSSPHYMCISCVGKLEISHGSCTVVFFCSVLSRAVVRLTYRHTLHSK